MYSFSIFKELYNTDVPYTVSLEKVVERIKNGTSKDKVERIRNGEIKLKSFLPCIVFAGTFSHRAQNGLLEHSGLMVVDFDKIPDPYAYKEELKKTNLFLLLFISPSGNGVKGVVKINKCNSDEHAKVFKAFEDEFKFDFFDISGSNVDRICFESYDPDIYVNLDSKVYNPKLIDKGYSVSERVPLIPLTNEDVIIKKIMNFNWNKSFVEGQRNSYVFDLAGAFCEYGVNELTAINFINNHINLDVDFSEREVINAVKSAYKLRSFNSRFFEDYKKINSIKSDLKYDKNEVIKKYNITNEVYSEISNNNDNVDFWFFDKQGNIKIDPFKFKLFLEANGFRKYYPNDVMTPQLVKVNSNKVKDTSNELIRDFILNWLLDKKEFEVWKRCVNYQNIFSENYLAMLDTINLMMLKDTKESTYLSFKNGIVEVTKNDIKLIDYIDVDGYVWEDSIINREFIIDDDDDNDYKAFVNNISNKEPLAIESVIGYLLSSYKNKMNNKAIILNDEVISENPEGGTGKGVFVQGIKQIRKTAILDGKTFSDKKSFPYQTVSQDVNLLVFDDVVKNFNFESKFSLVTEGLTLERKNKDAIKLTVEESPKLVISTNYAIKGEGNSHDRRRHELEFCQYYNGTKTPYDEFGRQLFDDWNSNDFNKFDNYMIKCIQVYLKNGLIKQNAKNIKLRKFIAETSMEFYEWVEDRDNVNLNVRNDKSIYFDNFINDYTDFKKWLTKKKFNIWMQKYASFKGFEYQDGNSNGNRWFSLVTDSELIEDDGLPW